MPTLELVGDESDCDTVLAAMLFPDAPESLRSYAAFEALERRLKSGKKITLSARDAIALLKGPGRTQMRSESEDRARDGSIAGDLLVIMFERSLHGQTVNRKEAIKQYQSWINTPRKRFGDGEPIPKSRMTIISSWERAKSVAHLWAAKRLGDAIPGLYAKRPTSSYPDLVRCLQVASAFEMFAVNTIAQGHLPATPLIDKAVLLGVPKSIKAANLKEIVAGKSNRPFRSSASI